MASIDELSKKLKQAADELEVEIPNILLEQEITAKSLVQDRVQETGKDAKGGQLGDYSTKKIPAFFFIGKGKKATDNKLRKLAREKKNISYSDFRQLDGKQSAYVDLTFTGQMWRQTGLVQKQITNKKSVIVIGQTTERSEKVADYNTIRYGNFLELSESEVEIITQDFAAEVEDIINRNINGL